MGWISCRAAALRQRWLPPERIRVLDLGGSEPELIRQSIEEAIDDLERRLQPPAALDKSHSQIQVEFEGEFFAGHSFSNVNEQVLLEIRKRSINRRDPAPGFLQPDL